MEEIYNSYTDHELLSEYRNGDVKAFDLFYQRHEKRIFSYIKYSTINYAMAEECCQDVWMKLIDKLDYILESTNSGPKDSENESISLWTLYPYLKTMARNTVINAMARKNIKLDMSGDVPLGNKTKSEDDDSVSENTFITLAQSERDVEPENTLECEYEVDKFDRALQLLPEDQKQAWLLSREKQLSLVECAEIEGITVEAFRTRLRRAKDKLTPVLNEIFPDWKERGFTNNRSKL